MISQYIKFKYTRNYKFMNEEIIETAKATQEVAKTTTKAIEAVNKVGSFLSKALGEPIEEAIGMIGDKLKFMRWERQIRLIDKVEEISQNRKIIGKEIPIPPKLFIPIMENASLEDNNTLQDIWARLIVSSQDEKTSKNVRVAYIDIIKQLEDVDVMFLDKLYYWYQDYTKQNNILDENFYTKLTFSKDNIIKSLDLSEFEYQSIVDNLMRVRCIRSEIKIITSIMAGNEAMTIDKGYNSLQLTALGVNFIQICVTDNI